MLYAGGVVMKKWWKYLQLIRRLLYITFIIIIIARFYEDLARLIFFLSLFLLAATNDILRYRGKIKSDRAYYMSLVASIIIGAILYYLVDGYLEVYLYIIMAEIPWIINKRAVKALYALNVFTIFFVSYCRFPILDSIGLLGAVREYSMGILFKLLMISFFSVSIFSYVALVVERNKVLKLNNEIEELTITKERNRIAQNIHDNLGHSLVALNMNLDVTRNIIDEDKDKAKELLDKCQLLVKESMKSLRKAVYTLKEEDLSQGLIASIKGLIDNINDRTGMSIVFHIDEKVENIPLEYKSIIYATIKEGLTNCIKHSRCSEIKINIHMKDKVHLRIEDNGIGCDNFIKGNGLKGIEERINKLNGHIDYMTKEGQGFKIIVALPL